MTFASLVSKVIEFINVLIPAIFAVLFVYLIWKVIDSWILHAGDQNRREEGRRYLVAAVIAFVVMISAWGIIGLIRASIFG